MFSQRKPYTPGGAHCMALTPRIAKSVPVRSHFVLPRHMALLVFIIFAASAPSQSPHANIHANQRFSEGFCLSPCIVLFSALANAFATGAIHCRGCRRQILCRVFLLSILVVCAFAIIFAQDCHQAIANCIFHGAVCLSCFLFAVC